VHRPTRLSAPHSVSSIKKLLPPVLDSAPGVSPSGPSVFGPVSECRDLRCSSRLILISSSWFWISAYPASTLSVRAGGDFQACPGFDFTVLGLIFTGLRTVSFCRGLVASRTADPILEPPDQRLSFLSSQCAPMVAPWSHTHSVQ
jgi:hypothetical protein